jgi:hypothetical protein
MSVRRRISRRLLLFPGEMVISSEKYEVKLISKSLFEIRMVLVIRNIMTSDLGPYRCIAKNSLGEVESNIRLYGEFSKTNSVA